MLALLAGINQAAAQGTAFTYNGKLNDGATAASGSYDLRFTLYDAGTNGNVFGSLTNTATAVSNGLFLVTLDFGGVFNGANYWLEIAARTNGSGAFSTLSPRQPIPPTPYAIYAANAGSATTATTAGIAGSATSASTATTANSFTGPLFGDVTGIEGATVVANVGGQTAANVASGASAANAATSANTANTIVKRDGSGNFAAGAVTATSFSGDGANVTNLNASKLASGTLDNARLNANVAVLTNASNTFSGAVTASSFTGRGALAYQTVAGTTQNAAANAGYVLTNAAQTTVTLPTTASAGDLVRVLGTGAGGWQVQAGGSQSLLGGNPYGPAGVTWTARENSRSWQAVASSADGSKLVAGVYGGQIYISTDSGVNWTAHDSSRYWRAVASSADGSKLVAVVFDGQIFTSIDSGTNWTARENNRFWYSVASSADGSKLVAGVAGGLIYTSTDSGVSWTGGQNSSKNWQAVASSADGSKLVAVTINDQIYTSDTSFSASLFAGASGTASGFQYLGNNVWQAVVEASAGSVAAANLTGTLTAAQIPNLDAAKIVSGTLDDARLSANVALLNASQTFSGVNTFNYLAGNGGGLINLATPTIADYIHSYSTTTQAIVTAGTFQDITNNVDAQLSGWTHTADTVSFTNAQSGLYLIQYTAEATATSTTTTTVSLRAVVNGTEIADSQSTAVADTANQIVPISKSFIASFNSGDVLKFQFAGSSTVDRIVSNSGLGTTRPSFSCTIIRLQ